MSKGVLILGATGMLGRPVTRALLEKGRQVHILARDVDKARRLFGAGAEIFSGSALNAGDIQAAMAGCRAIHISLGQESELVAMQHVVDLARDSALERITYVSATTAFEQNRWFDLIDVKLQAEDLLYRSGLPYIVFCPTWAMETLHNFVREDRAVAIISKDPPRLHFLAAADFGRMVAGSYEDDRGLGKRLFVHGPEAVTLPDALARYLAACYPDLKVMRMKLWQARLIARLTGRQELASATELIAYFDKVGEMGDPSEANALFGPPSLTLEQWFSTQN